MQEFLLTQVISLFYISDNAGAGSFLAYCVSYNAIDLPI